ncbi:jg3795, partial [Pararge aegeria aegeria]
EASFPLFESAARGRAHASPPLSVSSARDDATAAERSRLVSEHSVSVKMHFRHLTTPGASLPSICEFVSGAVCTAQAEKVDEAYFSKCNKILFPSSLVLHFRV